MDSCAYVVGFGLLRATARHQDGAQPSLGKLSRAQLRPVLETIEARIDEPLRSSDLASVIGMSLFHFARIFKAQLGETPARYVRRRRLERALELIKGSSRPLAEIAYVTGFSSQAQMSNAVTTATELTPRALRTDL